MLDKPRSFHALVALASLAVFGAFGWWVINTPSLVNGFDSHTASWTAWELADPTRHRISMALEWAFGLIPLATATVLTSLWLFIRRHYRAAYFVLFTMLLSQFVIDPLKALFSRPRPVWQDLDLMHEGLTSYPSGHVANNTVAAGIVVVLTMMLVRRVSVRRVIYVIVLVCLALVYTNRLMLGRHFVTDIIGSPFLALAVLFAMLAIVNPLPRTTASAQPTRDEDEPTQGNLAVILNPVKVESVEAFRTLVATMAKEAGWGVPTWHYTTVSDPGAGMATLARQSGSGLVLVCGGDGTVREVCATLAGSGIPVGIIPAGTGNLLARNLEVPLFLRAAIDVALTGRDKPIDMVEVSGDGMEDAQFMVMAGMGMDAAIMEGVNEDTKKKVGWLAYVVSGAKSLTSPALKIEVTIDDEPPVVHRARTVVVGNVGYLQAGMPLLPDATIDDGLLDVVIINPKRLSSWGPLAARVVSKGTRTDESLNRFRGASVTLRTASPTPRQLDGDSVGPGIELVMRCVPGQVVVRVPR